MLYAAWLAAAVLDAEVAPGVVAPLDAEAALGVVAALDAEAAIDAESALGVVAVLAAGGLGTAFAIAPADSRRTMNWSDACASVRIHAGAVLGKAEIKRCDAAFKAASTSSPGDGGAGSAVATKYTGCRTLKSAAKVPGVNKSSNASSPLSASIRCQKFQYQAGAALYRPWLIDNR